MMQLFISNYPGQLPEIRRDLHNVIVPVDFASHEDMLLVVNQLLQIVKRSIPVRIGLVPTASTPESTAQLKVAHYLQETYGLGSLIEYLEACASKLKGGNPDKSIFNVITKERKVRAEKQTLSLDEVLKNEHYKTVAAHTVDYQRRLSLTEPSHFLVNGVLVSRESNWMQEISMNLGRDSRLIQQAAMEGVLEEDAWLPEFFMATAFERRNPFLMPEDPKSVQIVDLADIFGPDSKFHETIPSIAPKEGVQGGIHIIVVADLQSPEGLKLLGDALKFRHENEEIELLLVPNGSSAGQHGLNLHKLQDLVNQGESVESILTYIGAQDVAQVSEQDSQATFAAHRRLAEQLGFKPGTSGLVVNGRVVGPISEEFGISVVELGQLVAYERSKRIDSVVQAAMKLGFSSKISTPLDLAKLTSLVSLSMSSIVPEGIFESTPDFRLGLPDKWKTDHSVITVSSFDDPAINVAVALDPASELAQKWLPVLKVLSELAGVQLKIFLNPKEELSELPVKRFYRYVLESEPSFGSDGYLSRPGASFTGVPVEALLTLGMDVPSSWLVAPKESVHDLDNIKLGSLKAESNVDAIYALEHILIEGHSRDVTLQTPPRGVQLVLGTEDNPHFADTIIMANLGYFQFKAQPGLWQINLKPGRSEKLFNIDSVGGVGFQSSSDDNNEVTLLSFQGLTLFPRLSRKPGHETDDVLETSPRAGSTMDFVSKGLNFASGVLSSVGVGSKSDEQHADINIFSVASGHLYERMLNIMMVSVMRHTKHTVKFWFIEQFLSPSFRTFLPHLAREYNFSYEMVTYKWPHWLRAQREKQREIWGYKMLFLDVLFPLSLDKVIFVDADQIVRTDMYDLVTHDLQGAPYGFTPMGDSRTEMEGFRFWKQGYWNTFLRGKPYHISALYVVDLNRFRELAAGDRLRGQYQMLSADPNSLSNLDQDLPNHMQHHIPIHSLPQEWLWCETWCSDEDLVSARTIDLCNNPLTKEPKLQRARRQVPEWTVYDDEIADLARRAAGEQGGFVRSGEDGIDVSGGGEGEEKEDEDHKDEL